VSRWKEKAHWVAESKTLCGAFSARHGSTWTPLIAVRLTDVTCVRCQRKLKLLDAMNRKAKDFDVPPGWLDPSSEASET
jgi:hypothetical protein